MGFEWQFEMGLRDGERQRAAEALLGALEGVGSRRGGKPQKGLF